MPHQNSLSKVTRMEREAVLSNYAKWSKTLKQFDGNLLSTNCLSVFDHFMELMFEGLKSWIKRLLNGPNLWNFCMIAQWSSENLLRWGIPLFIQSMLSYAPRRNFIKWQCNILKWSHSHVDSRLENSCSFS